MIKYTKNLLLLLSVFSFFMCSNNKTNNNKAVVENISIPKPGSEKFSNVYEFNKIIKLETTDESIFAVPSKVIITASKIFILDQTRDKLLVFDEKGNFIKILGSKGNGPNEYISINSFTINEEKNNVLFHDDCSKSIFYYTLDSLTFVKQEAVKFPFLTFEYYDSKLIYYRNLFPNKENQDLAFDIIISDYSKPKKITNKFFPYDYYNGTRGHTEKLLKTTDNLFFYKNYNDTIYRYEQGQFVPQYTINFYNCKIPEEAFYKDRKRMSNREISKELLKDNYIYSYRFFSTKNQILISYFSKRKHFSYIKNLSSGKELSIGNFKDDLGFCLDNREPDFFTKKHAGFVIYPFILERDKKKGAKIHNELKGLDLEDNPYLVLFSLKNI